MSNQRINRKKTSQVGTENDTPSKDERTKTLEDMEQTLLNIDQYIVALEIELVTQTGVIGKELERYLVENNLVLALEKR